MFVDRQPSAEHEEYPDPVRSRHRECMALVDLVNFGTALDSPDFAARRVRPPRPGPWWRR